MAPKAAMPDRPTDRVSAMRMALEVNAVRLLGSPRDWPEDRIRLRIAKQRDHPFTVLDHADVDATNDLAERQLCPAVISRKLSCGNKTEAGARPWEILTTIAATCQQTGITLVDHLARQMATTPETRAAG